MTSEVHFEKPDLGGSLSEVGSDVIAYSTWSKKWVNAERYKVAQGWNNPYTAWMEMPPAPVKPRRFVVSEYKAFGTTCWKVMDSIEKANNAIRIPNPEAAQAIADIYEENQ